MSEISSSGEESEFSDNDLTFNHSAVFDEDESAPKLKKRKARNILKESEVNKKRKVLRRSGQEYETFKVSKHEDGSETRVKVVVNKRYLGATCSSKFCLNAKERHCTEFSDKARKLIFHSFWSKDWDGKLTMIEMLVDEKAPSKKTAKTEYDADISGRDTQYTYHLILNGKSLQVCKKMFINTLGIGTKMLSGWLKKISEKKMNPTGEVLSEATSIEPKPKLARQSLPSYDRARRFVFTLLNSMPKLPSHYVRQNSGYLYLQTYYQSLHELHRFSMVEARAAGEPVVSWSSFFQIIKEMKIKLFRPRNDQCNVCEKFKAGNLEQSLYDEHIIKKSEARIEKKRDKRLHKNDDSVIILCFDVQAVIVCPQLKVNATYYKQKLSVHNFSFYNLKNRDVLCYIWDETEGGVDCNVFTSFIVDRLSNEILSSKCKIKKVILFSDSCSHQNKNSVLSSALQQFSNTHNVVIEHKYLEPGHTQFEVDSVHASIQRNMKNRVLETPNDIVNVVKKARLPMMTTDYTLRRRLPSGDTDSRQIQEEIDDEVEVQTGEEMEVSDEAEEVEEEKDLDCYKVQVVDHTFFKNYKTAAHLKSIRPGIKVGDSTVSQIRAIKYTPNENLKYKLRHSHQYENLPVQIKRKTQNPTQLYDSRLAITQEKYRNLQDLKEFLCKNNWPFYETLPVTSK